MDSNPVNTAKLLIDLIMRVDHLQREVSRLIQSRSPDCFVPLKEATRHLHCGRDWLVSQIKAGVLRPGIDFIDRTSTTSSRKRYLVNPVSALRWLNGAQVVAVKTKSKAILPSQNLGSSGCPALVR